MDIGAFLVILCFTLGFTLIQIAALWKLFTKANQPGWAAFVPFYNLYVWLLIIGRPEWWLILLFVPVVNVFVLFSMYIDLAKVFGETIEFGCLMLALPFIFIPVLAFSGEYQGPAR